MPTTDQREKNKRTYRLRREKMLREAKEKYWKDPDKYVEKAREKRAKQRKENPEHYIYKHVKSRAKLRGIEFSLSVDDIVIPDVCPLLGVPIHFGTNTCKDNSPALDRIDNTRGYVPGNVWVISHRANRMKGNATKKELREFCLRCLDSTETGALSAMP